MKKAGLLAVVTLFAVTVLATASLGNPFAKNYSSGDDRNSALSTGGYLFFEISSRDYYLIDTRDGRLWKMNGEADNPDKFMPVKYENAKGNAVVQPEENSPKNFPGRYMFGEISGHFNYMLDTVTGKVWKLQGTPSKPLKLILVPRMDQ